MTPQAAKKTQEMITRPEEIIITRIIDAPRDRVFKAWTTPAYVEDWWGPHGFTAPNITIDLRTGGKYLFCMRGPDGKDYWSGGTYHDIVKNERITCTDYFSDENGNKIDPTVHGASPNFPKESTVTITFKEEMGKTTLAIMYAPKLDAEREAMIKMQLVEGWKTSLDKLVAFVKKMH